MSKRRPLPDPDRRQFLKGATLAGAAAATPPVAASAQGVAPRPQLKAAAPGPIQAALETSPPEKDPQPEIHLRPDRRVKYDFVAKVLAAAQCNRMKKIGFVNTAEFQE